MKIDPDVYKAIIGLGIVAISLAVIAAVLKCLGNIQYDFVQNHQLFLKYFCREEDLSSCEMDHFQGQKTAVWPGRNFRGNTKSHLGLREETKDEGLK